ncbi:MAG: hypothetical protein ACOYJY_00070 [Acutalibacteraceae bacterium]|jgi:hypothetical protein
MSLFDDITAQLLRQENLPEWLRDEMALTGRVEGVCYRALERIKAILEDENPEDAECFEQIEEIVCVLESIGSNGGVRHDFG